MTKRFTSLLLAGLLLLLGCGPSVHGGGGDGAVVGGQPAAITLKVFLMSKCPFCGRAMPAVEETVRLFGGAVVLRAEFVTSVSGVQLTALHGEEEVAGNMLLACAQKRLPEMQRFVKLLRCMEETYREVPENFPRCAAESMSGEEQAAIMSCAAGPEGVDLLMRSAQVVRQFDVAGAPTFYVGDVEYDGDRSVESFTAAICAQLGNRHSVCRQRGGEE